MRVNNNYYKTINWKYKTLLYNIYWINSFIYIKMAAMEEAKRILYEKVIKKFTLQEVTRHKDIGAKNLIELISKYPGHGVGF